MSADSAINFLAVQETSDGDKEFEAELFEMFIEDAGARIGRLEHAIEQGDLEVCKREAHTIKGASANVGANRLPDVAGKLEDCDPVANKADAEALLAQIKVEFAAMKSEIEAYLA